jgi:hypothetical protein
VRVLVGFEHLKEKTNPGCRTMPAEETSMASSLVKFVGQLANQVKFEVGIAAQASVDGCHGHSVCGHWGERLRRTLVGAVLCQSDQVIRKRKAHDVLLPVRNLRVQLHHTGNDVKKSLNALTLLV